MPDTLITIEHVADAPSADEAYKMAGFLATEFKHDLSVRFVVRFMPKMAWVEMLVLNAVTAVPTLVGMAKEALAAKLRADQATKEAMGMGQNWKCN